MSALPPTSSQTVGPFFAPTLLREDARRNVLVGPDTAGERIRIEGRVLDGDGGPVPDALVEIWQANAHGRYHHPADRGPAPLDPAFTGFGRSGTDDDGRFWFETVKPGRVPLNWGTRPVPQPPPGGGTPPVPPNWGTHAVPQPPPIGAPPRDPEPHGVWQAAHILVTVFARGLLNHTVTRLYFADDPAIDADPVLQHVPAERRPTLLARPAQVDGGTVYRFDIILQGAGETVFFNV
jgi:protocatechuate 3,4-dioxygenase, alpha subunit